MTEQNLKDLIEFYKVVDAEAQRLKSLVANEEEFAKLDNLNRDLVLTQAHATHTLLSTLTIRIGLNLNTVRTQKNDEKIDENSHLDDKSTNEQESSAEQTNESE